MLLARRAAAWCTAAWLTVLCGSAAAQSPDAGTAEPAAEDATESRGSEEIYEDLPEEAREEVPEQAPYRAESSGASRAGEVVFVLPAITPEVEQALEQAVGAQLASLDLRARFERPDETTPDALGPRLERALQSADDQPALAIFLLDAPLDGHWLLYLVSADGERIMIRRMAADPVRSNVAVEAVAVIVRDYVSALRSGYRIGLAPASTPETPAEAAAMPAPEPSTEPWPRLGLTLAYRGSRPAAELPWQHGAQLGLDLALTESLRIALAYHLFFPAELDDPSVQLQLWRHWVEPGIAVRLLPGSRLGVTIQASVVGELFVRTSTAAGTGFVAEDTARRFLLGPGLRVQAELELTGGSWLVLGADVAALSRGVEVYVEEPARRLLFSASPLRWGISAGILVRP